MIYSSEHISISLLQQKNALQLNKLFVSNTERFMDHLPTTLAENRTLESTQNYIIKKIEEAKKYIEFVFVINHNYSSDIIGLIILKNLDWESRTGEFAYCIGKRFKGKELMTEGIKAVSNYAVDIMKLDTLQIISHKTNFSSIKVALQSGFKWKETLVNEFMPLNGAALDMELYELRNER